MPHKEISRNDGLVRYQIELQNNKRKIEDDIELFYAFNKSGNKERVWKPGPHLAKENLPEGYYFTNRYLNLSYQKNQPDRYILFTPVLRDINYTKTFMKIKGYLFLPLDEDYDLSQFKIKLSKFREEEIMMDFPLQLISPEDTKIFNYFPSRHFYEFNQLKVFLFEVEISLVSISHYIGIFNIGVEYNNRTRLIQNYHISLIKSEHTTTYTSDNEHLTLFNFYYDDITTVWRFEMYHMSQNEFLQLKKLNSAKTRDKKIWIIGEYSISARDNGMHFYHYMLKEHPEVDVYYVIEKNSKDLPYIDQQKVLYYGSYKHFEIASKAKVLVFSHMERYLIPKINRITEYKETYDAYLKVFLQHGVIATTASIDFLHKKLRAYNIFNVSSEFEKEVVKKYLGYSDQEIAINGLPRWDRLYRDKIHTKTILIIPTYRDDLEKVTDEVFKQSQYFKFWDSLLSDQKFVSYIEENNIKVHFFIHIILSRFIDHFSSCSKNIVFKNSDNIQDLLLNCGMLVTDYSSVSFDALFQNKPVIYVPFDYDTMINQRGGKQLIDYHNDLPGPVCYTVSEAIEAIVSTVNSGWVIDKRYHNRQLKFFKYIDDNNSERVYHSIISNLIE